MGKSKMVRYGAKRYFEVSLVNLFSSSMIVITETDTNEEIFSEVIPRESEALKKYDKITDYTIFNYLPSKSDVNEL